MIRRGGALVRVWKSGLWDGDGYLVVEWEWASSAFRLYDWIADDVGAKPSVFCDGKI